MPLATAAGEAVPTLVAYRNPLDLPRIGYDDILRDTAEGVYVEAPGTPRPFVRPPPAFHDDPDDARVFAPFGDQPIMSPPVFTLSLRGVTLVGHRTLLAPTGFWTNDLGHLHDADAQAFAAGPAVVDELTGFVATPTHGTYAYDANGRSEVRLSGPVVVLTSAEAGNFGSFIFRELPKVLNLTEIGPDWRFLIHISGEALAQFLVLAGVWAERIVRHDPHAVYHLDRAIVPGIRNPLGFADGETEALYARLREEAGGGGAGGRRIYVSRHALNATRPAAGRVMLNEAELIAALRPLGFEAIEPQTMTAAQQVETFAAADIVVGPSGSGLFNAVFCRPGTALIDIESEPHWALIHTCLFASAGLRYGLVEAKAADRDWSRHHKPFSVNIDAVIERVAALARTAEAGIARHQTTKTIMLDGVPTEMEGAADDPYFATLAEKAAGLAPFAALVARTVVPDATVLDVGANIGLSTILLARAARRVIAFEPSPANAAYLRRNLARNGIGNVEVIACAASAANGVLRFHEAQFGAGSHVVSAGDLSAGAPSIEVRATTIDALDLPAITFVKMDVEGHEPEVLAGARRLLARDRPLIHLEVNLWCLTAYADHHPSALIRRLWERFEVSTPTPEGNLLPLQSGLGWLHELVLRKGGADDLVIRPRAGAAMPRLAELTWPESALAALRSPA